VLIGVVGARLGPQLFLQPALGLAQPLGAIAWHRSRLSLSLLLQAAPGLAQPSAPTLRRAQLLGQLIAARVTVELVLGRVGGLGLFEDLARDLFVIEVRVAACVGVQLGAVDGDHADVGQARLRA
jgi:hypothetical protein